MSPENRTILQGFITQAKSAIAQIESMLAVDAMPGGGAIQPAAPTAQSTTLTTFSPRPGNPLPDTDPIPDKSKLTLAEWLAFLDDHSIALLATKTTTWPGEGDLIGYVMYRGGYAPNVALAMAKEWGPKYPAALTHCQMLRAIQQGVPYDVAGLTHWDAVSRTWLDGTNRPYVAPTEWTSVVAR